MRCGTLPGAAQHTGSAQSSPRSRGGQPYPDGYSPSRANRAWFATGLLSRGAQVAGLGLRVRACEPSPLPDQPARRRRPGGGQRQWGGGGLGLFVASSRRAEGQESSWAFCCHAHGSPGLIATYKRPCSTPAPPRKLPPSLGGPRRAMRMADGLKITPSLARGLGGSPSARGRSCCGPRLNDACWRLARR